MPRFYFHLHECGTVTEDEEGRPLADLAAARAIARAEARQVMSAEVGEGRLCLSCVVIIADEAGVEVGRMPFREALAVTGLHPG